MAHVTSEPGERLSGRRVAQSPQKQAESPSRAAGFPAANALESLGKAPACERRFERLAVPVIVLFWSVQFLWFSLDRLVRAPDIESWATFQARLIVSAVGALISFVILKVLRRTAEASFMKRALLAMALALGGAAINSVVNKLVFWAFIGAAPGETISVAGMAPTLPSLIYFFSWFYLALALILLSLTYGEELVDRERRIAELRADADRATLAALRYQLNPHFLFNALNSVASLVSSRRNRQAELMLENLADFLRTTLELGASDDITLRDELALQSLYLELEKTRFPRRLRVEQDVPDELNDVLVPSMLTQPLIENTIKHAVARSTREVRLTIAARQAHGKLHIEFRDNGGDAEASPSNRAMIGLQNVAKRLELHFGKDAQFEAGPAADGGFEARISMPIRRARCPS